MIRLVFKVFRNGVLGTCLTHAKTCGNLRVESATKWTSSEHALHMPKPVCVQSASHKRLSKTFQNRSNEGCFDQKTLMQ